MFIHKILCAFKKYHVFCCLTMCVYCFVTKVFCYGNCYGFIYHVMTSYRVKDCIQGQTLVSIARRNCDRMVAKQNVWSFWEINVMRSHCMIVNLTAGGLCKLERFLICFTIVIWKIVLKMFMWQCCLFWEFNDYLKLVHVVFPSILLLNLLLLCPQQPLIFGSAGSLPQLHSIFWLIQNKCKFLNVQFLTTADNMLLTFVILRQQIQSSHILVQCISVFWLAGVPAPGIYQALMLLPFTIVFKQTRHILVAILNGWQVWNIESIVCHNCWMNGGW